MVKIGFIVEGESEKRVLSSVAFSDFLKASGISFVPDIIDAKGSGQLLPHNREKYVNRLKAKGATHIIILTDKENEPCFTSVKERIGPKENEIVLVSAKALEAWFLADSETLSTILRKPFKYASPENTNGRPYDTLKNEFEKSGKSCADKLILADRMLRHGFTIEKAAAHKNCPSAVYFIRRLRTIASA